MELKSEYDNKITGLETIITELKKDNQITLMEEKHRIALEFDKEKEKLSSKIRRLEELEKNSQLVLENEKNKLALNFNEEKEELNATIKLQKQEIDMLKDFKLKQSTKMLGESLEQHCEIEYNRVGRTAFPNANFYKDNDAKSGSKGDYIYEEYDENDILVLSIMFEMKNEQDTTATKHKNKDFLKELDKDRKEKKCEYAVLVSMLEQGNELYNDITRVWEYDNMYIIRPQHFITIISLLRLGCIKSHQYKTELEEVRNTNIDIKNFEAEIELFKDSFGRNCKLTSDKFKTAINEIDRAIIHLNKIRENLLGSENNLRIANNKLEDLSIKKLGKGNATIQKLLEA